MKTSVKIFSFFFSVAVLVACSSAESEQLKQARTIQETMLKSKGNLDSLVDLKMNELSAKITEMSADSTLATDSLKAATYSSVKTQLSDIEMLKSKLTDWMSSVKMLPSVEEIAKGAENPFGDGAKDQDILKSIQDNQKQFEELKSEIETAIQ
jgi:cell division protein YceG involved in septum cleavage